MISFFFLESNLYYKYFFKVLSLDFYSVKICEECISYLALYN